MRVIRNAWFVYAQSFMLAMFLITTEKLILAEAKRMLRSETRFPKCLPRNIISCPPIYSGNQNVSPGPMPYWLQYPHIIKLITTNYIVQGRTRGWHTREGGRVRELERERPATVSGNQKETSHMYVCIVFRGISVYCCVDRYILVQGS